MSWAIGTSARDVLNHLHTRIYLENVSRHCKNMRASIQHDLVSLDINFTLFHIKLKLNRVACNYEKQK